ncbi:hypothetical protein [Thiohalomonas denitrificans]|uniref:hypothetical protein n=1 Tax=Thiohalomonas denitrificans TaxID=415747 RepID=UPI0026EC0CF8|nr:hypothetical protein [Thiohalomonas denitrificans]
MDRATRIYAWFLLAVGIAWLIWALYEDPQVSAINDVLSQDTELATYPYPFRVLRVEGNTAVVSTPRSPQVPVARIIGILYPAVAGQSVQSPAFQQAQMDLAKHQQRAKAVITIQPGIDAVRWELDRRWLAGHGIEP